MPPKTCYMYVRIYWWKASYTMQFRGISLALSEVSINRTLFAFPYVICVQFRIGHLGHFLYPKGICGSTVKPTYELVGLHISVCMFMCGKMAYHATTSMEVVGRWLFEVLYTRGRWWVVKIGLQLAPSMCSHPCWHTLLGRLHYSLYPTSWELTFITSVCIRTHPNLKPPLLL